MLVLDASACPPPVVAGWRLIASSAGADSARHTSRSGRRHHRDLGVVTVPAPHGRCSHAAFPKGSMPCLRLTAPTARWLRSSNGDAAMESCDSWISIGGLPAIPGSTPPSITSNRSSRRQGVATRVDEFAGRGRGWDYQVGTVSFADSGEVLLSRDRDRVSLCINSFSTPAGGIDAPLVDVGNGAAAADYEGKVVKGAVVLGSADAGRLWQQGVKARGAVGFISTSVAPYIRSDDPATFTSSDQRDVFQWSGILYDASTQGVRLQGELASGGNGCGRGSRTGPFT